MSQIEINNESFEITCIGSVGDDESQSVYYRLDRFQGDDDAYASALEIDPETIALSETAVPDTVKLTNAIAKHFHFDRGFGRSFGSLDTALYDNIRESFILIAHVGLDI